ncbi:MAG TPA: PAS domain S-box protein [Candidatus Hydrogenedentes bacterium]|nr:PAS domain S-box protein [Candidatus Hydrogenedentota bacterium]HOS02734.1 PAS domain S-box protein [Candidatus Hydrogenedentota bacterium]
MELGASWLRKNVEHIVKAAIEASGDPLFELPIRAVTAELLSDLEALRPLDTACLSDAGASASQITSILRAMEHQCIDLLWKERAGSPHCQCVAGLRRRLRQSLKRRLPDPASLAFFQSLLDGKPDATPPAPEPGRIYHLFENVMSSLRDMVYLHDFEGNILYLNRRGLAMTRYTREDLAEGLSIDDFVVPQYADVVEDRLQATGGFAKAPFTIEIFAKDGERIPVEIGARLLIENGKATGVLGIVRDLRLERRLENEIRRSNAYWESFLGNAPMGVLIADRDGIIRDANAAAASLCGAAVAENLFGQSVHSIAEHDDRKVRAALRLVVRSRKRLRLRIALKTRYGVRMQCDFTVCPLCENRGEVEGILILIIDMAEQMAIQHNLLHVERLSALGEIVGGVAHELNNPLTGILGYAQLLQQHCPDIPLRVRLARIEEEAQRCKRIVHNLLSFARQQPSTKRRQDINSLLRGMVEFREYQLFVDNVELTMILAPDLPEIEVDAQALQRVFLNLLNNAHQAMLSVSDRPRALSLSTKLVEQNIHILFADNGPGIPEHVQARVFDPFFTTKPPGEATGLGLSVCYGIVSEHGGHILLESRPDEGATFTVVLPTHPPRNRNLQIDRIAPSG